MSLRLVARLEVARLHADEHGVFPDAPALLARDRTSRTTLTDGLAETAEPVFDASGKYLYFLASTDAGPVKQWFDQSNADMQATHSVFVAVLAKDTPEPAA